MAARALVATYNAMQVTPLEWDAGALAWVAGAPLLPGVDSFFDVTISADGMHAIACGLDVGNIYPFEWSGSAWVPGTPIHVDTNPQCVAISADGQRALVACPGSSQIIPLNRSGNLWVLQTPIALTSARLVEIAPDGVHALVTSTGGGIDTILPLTWNGAAWVAGTPISTGAPGATPFGIAFHPDGVHALVGLRNVPTVVPLTWNGAAWVADPLLAIVDSGPEGIFINASGTEALVACGAGMSIVSLLWSGVSWTYASSLPFVGFPNPFDVFIGPDDNHAIVSASNGDYVMPLERTAGVWSRGANTLVGETPFGMGMALVPDIAVGERAEGPSYWNAHRTIASQQGDTIAIPQWVRKVVAIPPATVALMNDVGATVTNQLSGEWIRPSRLTACSVGAAGTVVLKY